MDDKIQSWLLEDQNPSIRHLTLTGLLDRPPDDPSVLVSKRRIMETGLVPKLLLRQNANGSWANPERFYLDKYHGTIWTLLLLAELGADGSDPNIQRACEFVFQYAQEPKSGAFSVQSSKAGNGGLPGLTIPCLTGNMVFALIRLGYLDDERVQKAIQWILDVQRADDGDFVAPMGSVHKRMKACFSRHSCHMGVAKALKGLAEIPLEQRSQAVTDKISELTEYFLIHHLFRQSHDLDKDAKPGWRRFGFPLMYQTDVLELLSLFAQLEITDPRLEEAVCVVESKRQPDGRWQLEQSFNGKMNVTVEKKGEPSKWITYRALKTLRFFR